MNTSGKALCLNMIVKNEIANIGRCLAAVADHISCWVIGDTGSNDGTQDFIQAFFAQRNIPGELHSFPFIDFQQARNAALDRAYASAFPYDYLLMTDADMELVVDDPDFAGKLDAPCYDLLQRSGISYWNARIVRRDAGASYRGVTHEYLDVPGGSRQLRGVWYKDHATGSNRVDKFERDIRLLRTGLEQEPENSRYWFYLAQSYRDAGRTKEASDTFAKRANMGGWDEEAWYARLQEARCRLMLKDEGEFCRLALVAFNQRPHRAEPLYDLARYYRERGMNDASLLFAEAALALERPENDLLFVEDFIYQVGLIEEYSIAANYARDPVRRDRGFTACDWLALNRDIPSASRDLARQNLRFYVEPADRLLPSFTVYPVELTSPRSSHPTTSSIASLGERIVVLQCVSDTKGTPPLKPLTSTSAPLGTQTFLSRLTQDLDLGTTTAVQSDVAMGHHPAVSDARGFVWRGALWCAATVRPLSGPTDRALIRIDMSAGGDCGFGEIRMLESDGAPQSETGWIPFVIGDTLRFIDGFDPVRIRDEFGRIVATTGSSIASDTFVSGTQAVECEGGGLALVNELMDNKPESPPRYHHRFIWVDRAGRLRGATRPFVFPADASGLATGLAWHPDKKRLVMSYRIADDKTCISTADGTEIRSALMDVACLPSGKAPGTANARLFTGAMPIAQANRARDILRLAVVDADARVQTTA